MSPSAIESVQETVGEIKQKVLPIHEGQPTTQTPDVKPVQATDGPKDALPQRYESHRKPLKLSGALDQFEHFDVTPVIGREYVNVNVVELLEAPNSDELLRDLAITSAAPVAPPRLDALANTRMQSRNAAWSSSGRRTA